MKRHLAAIVLIMAVLLAACAPGSTPVPAAPTAAPTTAPTIAPTAEPTKASTSDPALTANAWQWIGLTEPTQQIAIETPANYTVTFQPDGTVAIKADCNNAAGSYTTDQGAITISVGPMTMAACPPGSRSDQFVRLLGGAARYHFKDGQLLIDLKADGGTMTFASAEKALVPSEAVTTTNASKAVLFDLGPSVITQTWVNSEKIRYLPIELQGMIAVPSIGENLPIAVIMHGSHEIGCPSPDGYTAEWPCPGKEVPNYQGFAYLLEALAARGYVAISINANPAFVSAYGMPTANDRLPLLIDQYLAKIAAANAGEDVGLGVDLKGRLDWKELVVLGHSAGGEAVNWVIESRADRTTPDQINAGQGPIAAAVLLAPTAVQDTTQLKNDFALAVILPACDRDVADLSGQKFYEVARRQAERDKLAASAYLLGMNHNRFNTELSDETLANTSSICENALVPAEEQRQFLADYVTHFFDAALKRGTATAADLDPAQPAPSTLFDRAALTSLALPTSQRLRVPLLETGAKGTASAVYCQPGYTQPEDKAVPCRRNQVSQPGDPEQVVLTWKGSGGTYEAALPAGQHDLSDYAMLHLRAVVDPIDPLNPPGQPQAFSLRLTDGAGKSAVVALQDEPALAFPAGKKGHDDSLKLDTWDNHVILSSIRVPLTKFSGVDLSDIRSVALVFDQTDHGSIFVTDVEFLKPNP